MRRLSFWTRSRTSRRSLAPQARLQLEALESRLVPYNVSGYMWPHPQLISISFVPDGTNLGGQSSNLFSVFNAKFGSTATWQNVILKAAQVWAQQTNINFTVIPDSGAQEGSGSYQQGDPTMGDIRIGGFNFGSTTLASAFMPPPVNNFSIAGDIQFNTAQTFNIGQTFDLFTVASHEFGHALGMEHSNVISADMYAVYSGAKYGLSSDDVAGIRNIYSNNNPRSTDAFGALNNSFANAGNVNSSIDSTSLTALVSGMDITTAGQKSYYTLTAPQGTGNTVTVSVQSQGLSLLAPKLYIYSASQTLLGSASGTGHYGTTLTVNLTNQISAGQQFYVEVAGADTTALGTGAYALTMSFAGNPLPTVPLPNTQTANGSPLSGGGGSALTPDHSVTQTDVVNQLIKRLTHGSGCQCPLCTGAAAAAHQPAPSPTLGNSHATPLHTPVVETPSRPANDPFNLLAPMGSLIAALWGTGEVATKGTSTGLHWVAAPSVRVVQMAKAPESAAVVSDNYFADRTSLQSSPEGDALFLHLADETTAAASDPVSRTAALGLILGAS